MKISLAFIHRLLDDKLINSFMKNALKWFRFYRLRLSEGKPFRRRHVLNWRMKRQVFNRSILAQMGPLSLGIAMLAAHPVFAASATGIFYENPETPYSPGTTKTDIQLHAVAAESLSVPYDCGGGIPSPQSGYQYQINDRHTYAILYAGSCEKAQDDTVYYTCSTAIFASKTLADGRKQDDYFNCLSPYPEAKHIDRITVIRPIFTLSTNFSESDLGPGQKGLDEIYKGLAVD